VTPTDESSTIKHSRFAAAPDRLVPVHSERGEGAAACLTVAAVGVDQRLVEIEEDAT